MTYILIFAAVYLALNVATNGRFSTVYMVFVTLACRIALITGFIFMLPKIKTFHLPQSPALENLAGLLIIPLIAFNVWAIRAYMKSKRERAH